MAGLSGAVLASLIVALAVAVTSNARIRRESAATAAALRDRTAALGEKESALAERETALTAARENALKERRRYYTAQINLASQAWKDGQPARTSQLLETLRPRRGEIDLRGFEWRHLYHVCNANVVNRWRGHASAILDSAWSPQGDEFATASSDGYVRFWDGAAGELRGEMATNEEMWYGYVDVAFDGSGALLATLRSNGEVRIWDVARRQPLHRWTARGVGHGGLAISPRGDTVAVGGVHSQSKAPAINLWTLAGERTQSLLGLVGEAAAVAFSPDGQYLAAAVRDDEAERNLVVWRLTPQPEIVGELADVGAGGLEFSHDGASLWASCDPAASDGASLHEIETAGWTLARSLHGHSENVLGLGVDAAGRSVATASADRSVRRWDPAS
ncbi:MAG TPA: hypothetical protein PJ982_05940, partial [Lacipirellulaceae bacterium]|nr:hypothetical protein [Lacipirellulaceae bacterium]